MIRSAGPIKRVRQGPPRRGRVVDKKYLAWIAEQPCCVCGCYVLDGERVTVHHVRAYGSPKNDRRTIPLLARYHLIQVGGSKSIEGIGKRKFEELYGIGIEAEIARLQAKYREESGA